MRNIGVSTIVHLVLLILWMETSLSADHSSSQFNEEVSKQENIYHSRGEQRPDGYVIDRTLLSYEYTLSPAFGQSLANLGPKDRWLDIGAGRGQAILDYFAGRYDAIHADQGERRDGKAQVVAISIEDRTTPLWHQAAASLAPDQMRYLSGKRLREYSLDELGQFQVITDVIGGFSYAANLSLFVEKTLNFLKLNGSFYTLLQDIHSELGANLPFYKNSPFLTEIVSAAGSEVRVCTWLKSITCVKVTCELKPNWQPPVEVFHIHKVCNDVAVPTLLPVHYEAGTPPERRFRLPSE